VPELLQHKHCYFCGKAIHVEDVYCDETCKVSHKGARKKQQNKLVFYWLIMFAMLMVAFIVYM